ncbi:unnamed protein product [Laminaria digitata]
MLAAQTKVNHALTALERRLVSLVRRQAPTPSPGPSARPTARPAEARARRGFSAYPPPRGSRSPCAVRLGEEQQPQRFAAVAPTGGAAAAATAPLAAAAVLLMERAWSFRQDLLGSADKLRERSVALAVAEATGTAGAAGGGGGGGGGAAVAASDAALAGAAAVGSASVTSAAAALAGGGAASAGSAPVVGGGCVAAQGSQSPPSLAAARRFPLSDRQGFAGGTDEERRGLRGEVLHGEVLRGEGLRSESVRGEAAESTYGGIAGSLTLHPASDSRRGEPRPTAAAAAAVAAAAGGVPGVSCCLDFDRILGDDSVLAGPAEGLPGHGQSEGVVGGSPLSPVAGSMDRSGPVSGMGVVVDRPLLGFGLVTGVQISGGGGGGGSVGGLSARERRHSSDLPRVGTVAPDAWSLVLRDVSAAEERCREFVLAWESAGGALGEACEDLGSDCVGGLAGFFAPQ